MWKKTHIEVGVRNAPPFQGNLPPTPSPDSMALTRSVSPTGFALLCGWTELVSHIVSPRSLAGATLSPRFLPLLLLSGHGSAFEHD